MDTEFQIQLKTLMRSHFGPSEMRFYDGSVTVTLIRDFGKYTADQLEQGVYQLLDTHGALETYSIEMVNSNRFKLKLIPKAGQIEDSNADIRRQDDEIRRQAEGNQAERTRQAADETEDAREASRTIGNMLNTSVKASTLEQLLREGIADEIENFILTNLGAAMVILEKSKHTITLDETKELMRFSYLSGLWANAREKDLEILAKIFNDKFAQYSAKWAAGESNDTGQG